MNEDQQQPPMSGNDDLAKTLNDSLQFEETPMAGAAPTTASPQEPEDDMKMPSLDPNAGDPDNEPYVPPTNPVAAQPELPKPVAEPAPAATIPEPKKMAGDSGLEGLKTSALEELRPLVGKLNLPPEEQFDTLLLIIRSTDDQSLLSQAHEAAKQIPDETRRAQALLDVIKEIDYFSSKR